MTLSVTVSGSIEAAERIEAAAAGISHRKDSTVLAYVDQYWHMLTNFVQLNGTHILVLFFAT